MAVSVTICSQDFAGATIGVPLPVNFPVLDIGDIYAAYLLVGGETFINLTPETDFTRQDLGGGHYTLTPLATYASDIIFKVFRSTAIIQPYSFDPLGPLPADQVSGMGDRLCMLEQETRLLAGLEGPAVTLPPGATGFFPTAIAADSTARGNLIPLFIGQLLVQLNSGGVYRGTALTAGAWTLISGGGGSGTVTSVDVSGGGTGLTTSGGPVTGSGTITLSGTLAPAHGGSGFASYANGQLLIGKTDGTLAKATLTAGTGISVTNGDGVITLANTGVIGPVSAADNAIARYDSTTGALVQNSLVLIDDSGNINIPAAAGIGATTRFIITFPSDGVIKMTNNAANGGFCLSVDSGGGDNQMEILKRNGTSGGNLICNFIATPFTASSIASASTIAPTAPVTIITGTANISTVTPSAPITNATGRLSFIPTGAFTWDAAGNIAISGTAVVSRLLDFVWNSGTSKWYPSYV